MPRQLTLAALRLLRTIVSLAMLAPAPVSGQTETVIYYHTDAIGSVRMTTDATGQVVARYDFLPFGEPWTPPGNADFRQFAGKERDKETGFDYFGARYYSGAIGRFTTADSALILTEAMEHPQRWNRYAYVSNNPLRKVDPDGHWERDVHYDLTRALALAAGFDSMAAEQIASWNLRADTDSDKTPITLFSTEPRELYHFTTLERRMELARAGIVPGRLKELGLFLHAEQDSFSHFGYGPTMGHLFSGHRPDQTWLSTRKADAMVSDSYSWLAYAKNSQNAVPWDKLVPYVQRFNSAISAKARAQRLRELQEFIDDYRRQLQ